MKKDTWKTLIQIAISILTAIATTLGITSCTLAKTFRHARLASLNAPLILSSPKAREPLTAGSRGLFALTY